MSDLVMYIRDASWFATPGRHTVPSYHAPGKDGRPACGGRALLNDDPGSTQKATALGDHQVCRKPACWNRWCFANGRCPACGQTDYGYEIKGIRSTFTGNGIWGWACSSQEQDTVSYPKHVTCTECHAKFNIRQATGDDHEDLRKDVRQRRAGRRGQRANEPKPEHVRRHRSRGA